MGKREILFGVGLRLTRRGVFATCWKNSVDVENRCLTGRACCDVH